MQVSRGVSEKVSYSSLIVLCTSRPPPENCKNISQTNSLLSHFCKVTKCYPTSIDEETMVEKSTDLHKAMQKVRSRTRTQISINPFLYFRLHHLLVKLGTLYNLPYNSCRGELPLVRNFHCWFIQLQEIGIPVSENNHYTPAREPLVLKFKTQDRVFQLIHSARNHCS